MYVWCMVLSSVHSYVSQKIVFLTFLVIKNYYFFLLNGFHLENYHFQTTSCKKSIFINKKFEIHTERYIHTKGLHHTLDFGPRNLKPRWNLELGISNPVTEKCSPLKIENP